MIICDRPVVISALYRSACVVFKLAERAVFFPRTIQNLAPPGIYCKLTT